MKTILAFLLYRVKITDVKQKDDNKVWHFEFHPRRLQVLLFILFSPLLIFIFGIIGIFEVFQETNKVLNYGSFQIKLPNGKKPSLISYYKKF